jgi:site-specific DNA-methyltransferase (adenine-specific)
LRLVRPLVLGKDDADSMRPYFEADGIVLYHGDCREFVPPPCAMTLADPPYGQTSLEWDRWPDGWVRGVSGDSLWCFGSLRMFMEHAAEFDGWKLAQDLVWEKQNGSSFHADRFRRVHEQPAQFYRGEWGNVYKAVVTTADATRRQVRRKHRPPHMGHIEASSYESHDGGPRMMRSVIYAPNCHGFAEHPTQKPFEILQPLIEYSCPAGERVYVPFAGSGSELEAARLLGRFAVGVEIREQYCETAAKRLEERRARQWSFDLAI